MEEKNLNKDELSKISGGAEGTSGCIKNPPVTKVNMSDCPSCEYFSRRTDIYLAQISCSKGVPGDTMPR